MQTQTKPGELEFIAPRDAVGLSDSFLERPEFERKKELLVATFTDGHFKDRITMCSFNMLETGKASAFAVYEHPEGTELGNPVFTQEGYVCRFDEDTKRPWCELTKVDEFLKGGSVKKQDLLCKQCEGSNEATPRDNVLAVVMTFPLGNLWEQGLKADDIRRPTQAMVNFFLIQEQLNPGFVGGVLTNDGNNSGLFVFKKSEQVEEIDVHTLVNSFGPGDSVEKGHVLRTMSDCGITFADINLNCSNDQYEERVAQAFNSLYITSPQQVH
ncbi:MAG: hypothetical protein NTV39_04270 [Candidatus Saccharibacteria bacterium]|nr:hypothetical protein [Candidatus Saccharibacteria bacterium]